MNVERGITLWPVAYCFVVLDRTILSSQVFTNNSPVWVIVWFFFSTENPQKKIVPTTADFNTRSTRDCSR